MESTTDYIIAKEVPVDALFNASLHLRGKATDNIWLMEDVEGYIGVRLDSGDAGTVYLTTEQARSLAAQLTEFTA